MLPSSVTWEKSDTGVPPQKPGNPDKLRALSNQASVIFPSVLVTYAFFSVASTPNMGPELPTLRSETRMLCGLGRSGAPRAFG